MYDVTVPDYVSAERVNPFNVFEIPPTANVFSGISKLYETHPPIFYNTTPILTGRSPAVPSR